MLKDVPFCNVLKFLKSLKDELTEEELFFVIEKCFKNISLETKMAIFKAIYK